MTPTIEQRNHHMNLITQPIAAVYGPEGWESVNDFLADWWADFPWDVNDSTPYAAALLGDGEFMAAVRAFDQKHELVGHEVSVEHGLNEAAQGR